jgi:hypothetical protein
MRNSGERRIAHHIAPGEQILADAGVRSFAAIANQSVQSVRLVLTDRCILFFHENVWTHGVTSRAALAPVPLDEIVAFDTKVRHPPITLGIALLTVQVTVSSNRVLSFGASGFHLRDLRRLLDQLGRLRPDLSDAPVGHGQ